jgi:hypothetical protein
MKQVQVVNQLMEHIATAALQQLDQNSANVDTYESKQLGGMQHQGRKTTSNCRKEQLVGIAHSL